MLEFTEDWLSVTPAVITTRTRQTQASGPTSTVTVADTTQYHHYADGLIFLTELDVHLTATTTVTGFPVPPIVTVANTNITFDPMQFIGQDSELCEGMVLFFPSVTETLTINPDPQATGPIITQSAETTMTVLSINESVTVDAGTFTTIHTRSVTTDTTVDSWTDRETGLMVKNEVRDGLNAVTGTTVLIAID